MPYTIIYLEEFANWLEGQERTLRLRTLAYMELLKARGPIAEKLYVEHLEKQRKADEEAALKEREK